MSDAIRVVKQHDPRVIVLKPVKTSRPKRFQIQRELFASGEWRDVSGEEYRWKWAALFNLHAFVVVDSGTGWRVIDRRPQA